RVVHSIEIGWFILNKYYCRIMCIGRYVYCPTMPNSRLDPTSGLLVSGYIAPSRSKKRTINNYPKQNAFIVTVISFQH
ncbi:hypothetical protein GQ44DRAFT_620655, partial [Phaeosphaeriaceae sp. PMI808]